jgi:Zn-finger nucleic acid-binding protein
MRREKFQHVAFDICCDCRGIWVSGKQFYGLASLVADDGQVESDAKLTFQPRQVLRPHPDNPVRICPQCTLAMRQFNYAYDSNIFLSRCERCRGIWLDPNEIIDIAKHIQYNPEMERLGKSYLDFINNRDFEEEMNRCERFVQITFIFLRVLRLLVFKF